MAAEPDAAGAAITGWAVAAQPSDDEAAPAAVEAADRQQRRQLRRLSKADSPEEEAAAPRLRRGAMTYLDVVFGSRPEYRSLAPERRSCSYVSPALR